MKHTESGPVAAGGHGLLIAASPDGARLAAITCYLRLAAQKA